MAYHFIECNRDQDYLLPPSLKEWLPEKDLAWFVVDAVGAMDLRALLGSGRRGGSSGCASGTLGFG